MKKIVSIVLIIVLSISIIPKQPVSAAVDYSGAKFLKPGYVLSSPNGKVKFTEFCQFLYRGTKGKGATKVTALEWAQIDVCFDTACENPKSAKDIIGASTNGLFKKLKKSSKIDAGVARDLVYIMAFYNETEFSKEREFDLSNTGLELPESNSREDIIKYLIEVQEIWTM